MSMYDGNDDYNDDAEGNAENDSELWKISKWDMSEIYKAIDDTYIAFGTKYHEKHIIDEINNMKHQDFPFARAPELGFKWFGFRSIRNNILIVRYSTSKKPSMQFWWNSVEELLASTYN